tara:strand:+ start:177 stop:656 length:480 start_codon:yes stop_codon:yes gene_type:complete
MAIEFDDSEWFPLINFFKKQDNWQMILEEAGETIAEEAREDAIDILYSQVNNVKGSVGDSIVAFAAPEGDKVSMGLQSDHPAANMIEYGGLVPAEPFDPKSALPNIDDYADDVFAYSNYIKVTQPFKEERPFLRPALNNAQGQLNAEIASVAQSYAEDL